MAEPPSRLQPAPPTQRRSAASSSSLGSGSGSGPAGSSDSPARPGAASSGEPRADAERVEITNVDLSNTVIVVEDMAEVGHYEAETLARADVTEGLALADLHVRLALLAWNETTTAKQGDRSLRSHIDSARSHPLGARLLLSYGIARSSSELVEEARAAAEESLHGKARIEVLRDVVEAYLYRFGDPHRAAEVARAALADPAAQDTAEAAEELRFLYLVALAAAQDWRDIATLLVESATSEGAGMHVIAEALHVLFDRLDNVEGAAALLVRVAERLTDSSALAPAEAIHRYRVLFIALEIAFALNDHAVLDPATLYRAQLAMLEQTSGAERAAAALRFLLADALGQSSDEASTAAEILAGLADPAATVKDWGPTLAALVQCQVAAQAGEWSQLVAALRGLAENGDAGGLTGAYVWRAAELADARIEELPDAVRLWRAVLGTGPGGDESRRAIERLLLTENPVVLIGHLKALTGTEHERSWALRRAAAVAESRANNTDQSVALLTLADEIAGDSSTYQHLLRLYRRKQDRAPLTEVYRKMVAVVDDVRVGSVLLCILGAMQLEDGKADSAEAAFVSAARQAPLDPMARVALAGIYRLQNRNRELVTVLEELATLVTHPAFQARLLRELGRLQAEVLLDNKKARSTLEQALEIEPEHPATLHALARLHDAAREWDRAIELRQRALDLLDPTSESDVDGTDRVTLFMEIGDIEEKHRRNDEMALRAYEAAFGENDSLVDSLHAQARILRRQKRVGLLLDVLRAELHLGPDRDRQLEIQLEIAELVVDETGGGSRDSEASLHAYLEALNVDPGNSSALSGVLRIGRDEARWDVIARAYGSAPTTPANLEILAEAYKRQNDWAAFAQVRATQIQAASSAVDKGRLAHELGDVYHRKLSLIDAAADAFRQAIEAGGAVEGSQRALARMLEEHKRWPELAAAYEQELTTIDPAETERQIDLLLRLAALRRDRLARPADAVLSYEAVLELQPDHMAALEALADLYAELERDKELLRVLHARVAITEDTVERCQLLMRMAELHQRRDDIDNAVACYQQAFDANPSNRGVFTAMEKLCYKHERWDDAMALYQKAIDLVENGACRAYRLGDLYARRGQVQLQYLKDLDQAAESYQRVIELDPKNDTAVKLLESIYSQTSNWADLIAAYERRAEKVDDERLRRETLRRAARVAGNKLKDPAEAARIYELILESDGTDEESLGTLERFYERTKNWESLVGVLQRRLSAAAAGDATTALLKRIAQICEEGLRDSTRAVDHYRRILEIAPGNKESLDALARIFESTEQWTDFIDTVRKQIRVTSDRHVKALLYFKCGSVMEAKFAKEEDAIRYYDAAIKTSPSCLPAVHGLRDLYLRREDWPRVIQTLELEVKLWQDDKERAGVFAQIGRIYANNLEQPERALHYYESALAVDPDCVPANKALFEYHFDRGEWDRAQKLAQKLAQKVMREGDPSARSDFYRKCGIVSRMTGDPRNGAETLIIALEIKPTNLEALDALVDLARAHPKAYEEWDATLRELEKIYKKRDDAQVHLARVRVAQAAMVERDGDLEAAEELYAEATQMCPGDLAILSSLIELHLDMRRWSNAVEAITRFIAAHPPPPEDVRIQALMRQAEIHADYELDPQRAIAVLRHVISIKPEHQEAHYRLAQELYVLGRYDQARLSIDRVIELAAAPGAPLSPESLARYYYYRGRIIEASGDPHAATSQYRRAVEYDPGYAPPALALAKRAAEVGDQDQAQTMLIEAALSAMEQNGAQAAVPLQRGLARILLGSGDRPGAIEAYRGILNVQPDSALDRVALAEIYAIEDVPKAISELRKVINRDIYHAPAYRMLAALHSRLGENTRALRALSVMEMLGFAEDNDRALAAKARAEQQPAPLCRQLDENLRSQLMLTEAAAGPLGEIFAEIAYEISRLFPSPTLGENLKPAQLVDNPEFKQTMGETIRLYGVDPDVYIGKDVPGGVVVMSYPRQLVIIDQSLLEAEVVAHRFLLGWAFEAIRGGYAVLFSLGRRQRIELGSLLRSLLLAESERVGPTIDFIRALPRRAAKVIDRYAGKLPDPDIDAWMDDMMALAKRAGLFACDDFHAATRMIARLSGENPSSEADVMALGAVLGGADLVRFYLSDEYDKLREILSTPMTTGLG